MNSISSTTSWKHFSIFWVYNMFLSSSFPYTHLFLYLHKYKFTVSDREPPKEATSPARPVPRWPGIVYLQSEGVDPWWQWVNMHIWVMLSYETRSFESNLAMVKSTEHSPYLYAYMLLYIYIHMRYMHIIGIGGFRIKDTSCV